MKKTYESPLMSSQMYDLVDVVMASTMNAPDDLSGGDWGAKDVL